LFQPSGRTIRRLAAMKLLTRASPRPNSFKSKKSRIFFFSVRSLTSRWVIEWFFWHLRQNGEGGVLRPQRRNPGVTLQKSLLVNRTLKTMAPHSFETAERTAQW